MSAHHNPKRSRSDNRRAPRDRVFFQPTRIRERLRQVSTGARALYDEVAAAAGRSGWSSVRQGELAELLGVTTRTVRNREAELERAGLVYRGRWSHWIRKERGGVSRVLVPAVVGAGGRLEPPRRLLDRGARIRLGGREILVRAIAGLREAFRELWATYRKRASAHLSSRERRGASAGGAARSAPRLPLPDRLALADRDRGRPVVPLSEALAGLLGGLAR